MGYKLIKEHYDEVVYAKMDVAGANNLKESPEETEAGPIRSLKEIMNAYEKEILADMMRKCQNASEAARLLKINKSTISRKLARYNIKKK
ncbi:MAG TPA: helix-turn-helix domain-containing protein [Anaerovoracaceae bacterium]|nr:helix-turn-helix domain-containing protein [Anaerovoracaceae bacterium]